MPSFNAENFSLKYTLESGQFFCYEKDADWYYITTPQNVFKVHQNRSKVQYDGIPESELRIFLGLEVPYNDILSKLQKDSILKEYILQCHGLRVMRIDPWQCTASFICSSASNIPKIRRTLRMISQQFGKKVYYEGKQFYLFPQQGSLGNEIKGAGFRAPYLIAANKVQKSFFSSMVLLPYAEARQHLCQLKGVGKKIADCILLFGYNKWEAFPIDVWIQRALEYHYCHKNQSLPQLSEFAHKIFPHYPGYAQQFLYHGFRMRAGAIKQAGNLPT